MTTNNLTNSSALEEPDALEDLLNATGDPGPEPTLPPRVTTFLGEQLQAYYSHLMSEPVPERLVQFLQQLDEKEKSHDGE